MRICTKAVAPASPYILEYHNIYVLKLQKLRKRLIFSTQLATFFDFLRNRV